MIIMKNNKRIVFLILLVSYFGYGQVICDYGRYDFLFQEVISLKKNEYSSIVCKDTIRDIIFSKIEYDSMTSLKKSIYRNNSNRSELDPCYGIFNFELTYSKKCEVKDSIMIFNILTDENFYLKIIKDKFKRISKVYNDYESVSLEYFDNKISKVFHREFSLEYFYVNEKIEMIKEVNLNNDNVRFYKFSYNDYKISKISLSNGNYLKYFYINNKLNEIITYSDNKIIENKKFNYYGDKVIINCFDGNNLYKFSYLCFL
jgi:hypothetical protein